MCFVKNEVPAAAPLPNWEEEQADENQQQSSGHPGASYLDDDTTDDEFPEDEGDDSEPDPFINLLNPSETDTSENRPTSSDSGKDLKRKRNPKQQRGVRHEKTKLNPVFCESTITGVEACADPNEVSRVQTLVQLICGWKG